VPVRVRAAGSFSRWLTALKNTARPDDPKTSERESAKLRLDRINAFLLTLASMTSAPTVDDPPLLKKIRQRSR
jgi:hypothetical protein